MNNKLVFFASLFLFCFLFQNLEAASRSIEVSFSNNTVKKLTLVTYTTPHGIVKSAPPSEIANGQTGSWKIESGGFMTGAEGTATYKIEGGGEIVLWYNNPYFGSNEYSISVPPGYSSGYSGGDRNEAKVSFSISKFTSSREKPSTIKPLEQFQETVSERRGPDGHCKVRDCKCSAAVWRLLSFPFCGRDGCKHILTDHDIL